MTNANATLFINTSNSWSNAGTITLNAGNLNLGGSFTTAGLGTLNRPNGTAGTITLVGTLNNSAAVRNLLCLNVQVIHPTATAGGLGTWLFLNGTINGGTITTSGGAVLEATNNGSSPVDTLNSVTIDTGSTLQIDGGNTVAITNTLGATYGLTVNGTVSLNGGGAATGQQSDLGGSGQIAG